MRSISGTVHQGRRKKVLKQAKSFRGGRSRLYRTAKNAVMKAGQWEYRDRRQKKRFFRRLWIIRLNAACRQEGMSYSVFIHGLQKAGISLNRKSLSEMAISQPGEFKEVAKIVSKKVNVKSDSRSS